MIQIDWRSRALALALMLMAVPLAAAAPSYDGDFADFTNASTNNTYTVIAGTNQILIARVVWDINNSPASHAPTYNGVAMTLLRADSVGSATNPASFIYYLVSPATGAHTLAMPPTPANAGWRTVTAFTYSNVSQVSPIGASNGASGSDVSAPFVASLSFTPTSTLSTVVQLDWWQGAAGSTGYSVDHGSVVTSDTPAGGAWHSQGLANWNPPSLATVTLNQSWSAGWGDTYTDQAFELMPAIVPTPTATRTPTPSPTPTPQMILVKSASAATVSLGDMLTFCIAWTNTSNSTVTRVIKDNVPAAMTYMGADSGGTQSAGQVTWSFSMSPGGSGTVCFWGQVSSVP